MSNERINVTVRPMTLDDIENVVVLDRLAFPTPWSARTYRHEIENTDRSVMFVAEPTDKVASNTYTNSEGFLQRLFSPSIPAQSPISLVAYSGFWQICEEAHISTIAVHPDWRGKKIGELLIWIMVREAMRRKAEMVTLEVRVSNTIAQNLYHKYGFEVTGRRKGYYRDNHEDAYYMTVMPLNEAYHARLIEFGKELAQHIHVSVIGFTNQR
ncbi:MAG: ribosomal protein S18-alanine N-acetyltransferase [Anaerolineae bacterium]|nr:ribosomal protein S18-alanine N-acetyltransferase [Anaerolineae bacterium]